LELTGFSRVACYNIVERRKKAKEKNMLIGIEMDNLHPSLDKDKVLAELENLINENTARLLGSHGGSIGATALEPGDDVTEWVEVAVESLGCGDVTAFANVDFSLAGAEIMVDSVTLDAGEAIQELEQIDAFKVVVKD